MFQFIGVNHKKSVLPLIHHTANKLVKASLPPHLRSSNTRINDYSHGNLWLNCSCFNCFGTTLICYFVQLLFYLLTNATVNSRKTTYKCEKVNTKSSQNYYKTEAKALMVSNDYSYRRLTFFSSTRVLPNSFLFKSM